MTGAASVLIMLIPAVMTAGSYRGCSGESLADGQVTYVKDPALNLYDVHFYWIDLEMDNNSTFVSGSVAIQGRAVQPLTEMVLELSDDHNIDSVFINGLKHTDFSHTDDLIRIRPMFPIHAGENFETVIHYQGDGGRSSYFAGISNRTDYNWDQLVTYTLSESFNALAWFPCKQVLTDKADSAWIFLTTPETLKAGSNGILTGIDSLPGGRVKYKWKTRYPIAYYLISASVGDYTDYSFYAHPGSPGDSVLVQNYIYDDPSCLDAFKDEIDITSDLLETYSRIYGNYPFSEEKYGHVLAPMGGGMEHQTMTTLHDFNFTLVAHELVHQWFGDNVTCASWQDIWINEGFASYGEYLAFENLRSPDEAKVWMEDAHYWALSEPEGSVYIPAEDALSESRIFSRALSYKKGAAILHMIRDELQDDSLFFSVLRDFQGAFSDSTATGDDFLNVLNQTSGMDFGWFFDQWYYGSGFPQLKISWWQSEDVFNLHYEQAGSSPTTPQFRLHMEFLIETLDGRDTLVRLSLEETRGQFEIPVDGEVTVVTPDPCNHILEKTSLIRRFVSEGQFYVSPNPFTSELNLAFRTGKSREISLADMNGRIVRNWASSTEEVSLDTHGLSQGIYLLKVKEGSQTYTARLLRQ